MVITAAGSNSIEEIDIPAFIIARSFQWCKYERKSCVSKQHKKVTWRKV